MYLILSDSEGRRTDAVLLAASADRMRIGVPSFDDVVELKKEQERWISDRGEAVEIEAMVTAEDEYAPLARAAAGGMVS